MFKLLLKTVGAVAGSAVATVFILVCWAFYEGLTGVWIACGILLVIAALGALLAWVCGVKIRIRSGSYVRWFTLHRNSSAPR